MPVSSKTAARGIAKTAVDITDLPKGILVERKMGKLLSRQ